MAQASKPAGKRRSSKDARPRRKVSREQAAAIDYRDPESLKPYLSGRGRIKARTATGLSRVDQSALAKAVKRSRELALLPYAIRDSAEGRGERSERGGDRRDR